MSASQPETKPPRGPLVTAWERLKHLPETWRDLGPRWKMTMAGAGAGIFASTRWTAPAAYFALRGGCTGHGRLHIIATIVGILRGDTAVDRRDATARPTRRPRSILKRYRDVNPEVNPDADIQGAVDSGKTPYETASSRTSRPHEVRPNPLKSAPRRQLQPGCRSLRRLPPEQQSPAGCRTTQGHQPACPQPCRDPDSTPVE